jgi:tRNA pseudouridine38-40 synthase
MRTIKLTLAYDGADFHGWQVQPGKPTVQGEIMRAVEEVTEVHTHVDASGRTDAGVHALAQVASFHTEARLPCANLVKALNRLLPHSIRVLAAEDVDERFHARFQAKAKTYRYCIYRGDVCPPHRWRGVHHYPYPLDVAAMGRAAALLAGTHDFTSFAAASELPEGSRERTLYSSELAEQDQDLVYTVRGSGFLHHMVRNIAGTLLEVGKGNLAPEDIPRILVARDRSAAGPTAPAKGLWLVSVEY